MKNSYHVARRRVLAGLGAAGAAGAAGAWLPGLSNLASAQTPLEPTPACDDSDEPTPAQTQGPFYTTDTPEKSDFREPGMAGTPIVLQGFVMTRSCRPVAGALVDLWHADDAGEYDNEGFRLRGHQFADAEGRYRFATIVPGLYPGRTRHFHIRYQAPDSPVLTTQLYFPSEPANERDRIFRPELLLALSRETARFDAVLDLE